MKKFEPKWNTTTMKMENTHYKGNEIYNIYIYRHRNIYINKWHTEKLNAVEAEWIDKFMPI